MLAHDARVMNVNVTYPLDDGPDDPFRAWRRGEGAHVSVVDAGPAPGAPRVNHTHLLLPVLLLLDFL